MKKIIVFTLLLIVSAVSFSQQTNPVPKLTKADYLQKSKDQKNAGFIFLGGGAACVLIGSLISKGELVETTTGGWFGTGESYYKNDGTKAFFILTGFVSTLISIPFFTGSLRNKKKAMRLSFKNETVPQLQKNSFTNRPVPSLTLRISL